MRIGRLAIIGAVLAGCGGGASGGPPGATGTAGGAGAASACSDLFAQDVVRTYAIDIAPAEWQSLVAEFHNLPALQQGGNDFTVDHPVVVHLDAETTDATVKLHGQSSWVEAVTLDGDRAKMQFDVSFHGTVPKGQFHGVEKLVFDMPRDDWTFMHDRLAHTWLRQAGIAFGCAASARVTINGSPYGLYVVEENTGKRIIKEFFPDNAAGDLWKGGIQPETNQTTPSWDRQLSYWHATDIASVAAVVDLQSSLPEWAAEALINDSDGYYGGNHNFLIYDQGAKGFVFLPNDTDSTFDWLVFNDQTPYNDHPVYWWEKRAQSVSRPGHVWRIALTDPGWRAKYADAIAAQLGRWDVSQIQGWIDTWSQQIAADVAADPHTPVTPAQFQQAVAAAREVVAQRPQFLQTFVDCERNGAGADQDGDGVRWCDDCRDDDPAVHPGAAEVCGNAIDDNCDGNVDEGCGP